MRRHRLVTIAMTTLLASGPLACYEGPEGGGNGNGNGKNNSEGDTPQPGPKPIYYVLVHRLQLSALAMADAGCFPSTTLIEYKKAEWSSRDTDMLEALKGVSQVVSVKDVSVTPADCRRLSSIEAESIRLNPWPEGSPPAEDPMGRAIINLKVVYWDEQPGISPPQTVTSEHWQGAKDLLSKGRKVKSFTYFVLSRGRAGYFDDWQTSLPEAARLSGTSIDQVDPTDAGIMARNEIIKKDTTALMSWLLERIK